jgi:hypothetical protein
LRSKIAWWGFFVYVFVGTILHVVAGVFDPSFVPLAVASPMFNGLFAVGIYFASKPAFAGNVKPSH